MANSSSLEFTIASWNILSQSYLYPNFYSPECGWNQQNTQDRVNMILGYIKMIDVDILCLQECFNFNRYFKVPLQNMGYQCLYKKRPNERDDGCLICWKMSKFRMLRSQVLNFNDLAQFPFIDAYRYMKDCISIFVHLSPICTKYEDPVCVATTHIFWNPKDEDIKLRQVMALLYHLNKFKQKHTILCGDFNSTPDSAIVTLIQSGVFIKCMWQNASLSGGRGEFQSNYNTDLYSINSTKNSEDPLFSLLNCDMYVHEMVLRSVYSEYEEFENFTTWMTQFCGTIDYIFISEDILVNSICKLPTPTDFGSSTIPCPKFPSDHLILMCKLSLQ